LNLSVRALAAPAALLLTVGQGTCRGLGDTRTVLAIALGMNAFHLALDPLFIYGAGWGVSGAAAATVVAEVGAAAAYGVCVWRRSDVLGAHASDLTSLECSAPVCRGFKKDRGRLFAMLLLAVSC
jgi:MATE family multidrug resistance protein